jgi:two-component system sensor histidine kinase QseC
VTNWFSLRRRLLALLLGGVLAVWLCTGAFSYVDAHHEVDELFDAQLAQAAQTLLALSSHEEEDSIEEIRDIAHKYQRRLSFQVWLSDGTLMLRSKHAPKTPLTSSEGFSEANGPDGHWRYFSIWNEGHTLQVQVGEDHHIRDDLIGHIAWRLLLPALISLPFIALWVWFVIRHALRSLDSIAGQIAARAPQQLQPVVPDRAPEEIRPLLDSLNKLFQRVDEALSAERRFTADAAHELRTPLAALYAQAQVAQRARDETERTRSLGELQSGLMRASHLVDQMLQLARLDPESGLPSPVKVDLLPLAESVCAELGNAILDKQIDFSLDTTGPCVVAGQAEWLRVLIRNLVDNAIRYTPSAGRIAVTLAESADGCSLSVCDSGPGIPPQEREAVMQRFHRLDPSAQPGCGLGLAIVARIVELHGARLSLMDAEREGGLQVRVSFQRPEA